MACAAQQPTSALAEQLRAAVAAGGAERVTALCREVAAVPAPNPPGTTVAIGATIAAHLERLGLPVHTYAADPDKPNLVATIGRLDGPRVVLCGHMDTFPRPPAWSAADAYAATVADGHVVGTGVGDMRAGLAAILAVAEALAGADLAPHGGVVLVFTSDEESGGRDGAELVLREAPEVRGADACLIPDQAGITQLGVTEKGFCWLRLTVGGAQGHAAYGAAAGAIPALLDALRAVQSLARWRPPRPAPPDGLHESAAAATVTVNVGTLRGGAAVNLAAATAEATVDIRFPVGVSVEAVMAELRRALRAAGAAVEIETICSCEPHVTAAAEPVVAACMAHVAAVTGQAARAVVRQGTSDARLFRAAGIPTVVCGPVAHGLAGVGESVEVAELVAVAEMMAGATGDLLGHDRASPEGVSDG